jgi:hypothetical protein
MIGCWNSGTSEYSEQERRDMKLVTLHLRDSADVLPKKGILQFDVGSLQGGTALHLVGYWSDPERLPKVSVDASFWVKDDVIYAVNEKARELAPQLKSAPETITEEEILRVAH